MEYGTLIFLLISLWLLQYLLSFRQTKDYNKVIGEMKKFKTGYLGVGIARSRFNIGPGTVVILVVDLEGRILDLREMSGISVFSRFRVREDMIGRTLAELGKGKMPKTEKKALEQAVSFINEERRKSNQAAFITS